MIVLVFHLGVLNIYISCTPEKLDAIDVGAWGPRWGPGPPPPIGMFCGGPPISIGSG